MNSYASPSSSPPSPLPVSVGPGYQKYAFSSSPSLSPPFSQPPSSHSSSGSHPLLHDKLSGTRIAFSPFSLDQYIPDELISNSSCLKDLVEWLGLRCCSCWPVDLHSKSRN